jgi:hypothetical protein
MGDYKSNIIELPRWLVDEIEESVGKAYEVGHSHGINPMRLALNEKPQDVDKGWLPHFNEVIKSVKDYTKIKKK